jgi:hypothetical protein
LRLLTGFGTAPEISITAAVAAAAVAVAAAAAAAAVATRESPAVEMGAGEASLGASSVSFASMASRQHGIAVLPLPFSSPGDAYW